MDEVHLPQIMMPLRGDKLLLRLSLQELLVPIFYQPWNNEKAELITEPPSDFEYRRPGLGIQRPNN